MVKRVERQLMIRENKEIRTSMAYEKREELESTLRRKLGEQATKKEEARALMRL